MENNIVKVSLWGQTVGEIYWDEKRKQSCFSFSSDFIDKGMDIAPLTASIHNPLLARGEVYLGNKKDLYKGPSFLFFRCFSFMALTHLLFLIIHEFGTRIRQFSELRNTR